ncbi:signal peptidase I [Enterococcus sp. DIV0421]
MIIIAISVFPVFITFGNSMMPTLNQGDIVLSTDDNHYDIGDVVGFYIGNKLLVKRIIADSGQWVEINKDGELFIDGKKKNESYIMDSSLGNCNVKMPFKVPDGYYFVMGDYRTLSIDSRNTIVGCVSDEQIVGRIFFQVWPLRKFGFVDRY